MWESVFKNPFISRFLLRFPKSQWSNCVECVMLYSIHQLEGVPSLTVESLQSLVRGLPFQKDDVSLSLKHKSKKVGMEHEAASIYSSLRKTRTKTHTITKEATSLKPKLLPIEKVPVERPEVIEPGATSGQSLSSRQHRGQLGPYLRSHAKVELDNLNTTVATANGLDDWKLFRQKPKKARRAASVPNATKKPNLSLEEILPGFSHQEGRFSNQTSNTGVTKAIVKIETERMTSATERTCPSSSRNPEPLSPKKLRRKISSSCLPTEQEVLRLPSKSFKTEDSELLNIADRFLTSKVCTSFLDIPLDESSILWQDSTQISDNEASFTKKPEMHSSFLKLLKVDESPRLDSFEEYLTKRLKEQSRLYYN